MNKGLIFDIRRFSVHDGPGIRTTVFFKGCPMNCWWCHNPESRLPQPEYSVKTLLLDEREFRFEEVTGREMTAEEVMQEIRKDRIFFEESSGGVTLSGGEPLFQPGFTEELMILLKKEDYHVALDTCGYAEKENFLKVIPYPDLFLYDLKLMNDEAHKEYTGVSNRLILENLEMLAGKGKRVIIRFPVIPGITDTAGNINSLTGYLQQLNGSTSQHSDLFSPEIHLLPYHAMGNAKYKRLKIENKLEKLKDVDKTKLVQLKKKFETLNFIVLIGG